MNISSPSQAYVALTISYWSNADVIEWAVQRLQCSSSDGTEDKIQDIAWINTKQKHEVEKAGELLESYIHKDGGNLKFSNYENDAKQMLSHRIQQYLNGDCQPYDLCQMVSPIEHFYDFPDWLGDLYNSCDWCEPDSHPSDFRHLEKTANEVLNAL